MKLRLWFLAVAVAGLRLVSTASAVPFEVTYLDPEGRGFRDPVLGESRRVAFEYACSRWENLLSGSVPVTIAAQMPHAGGSGAGALLASAGAATLHRNFGGTPDTWYAAALANQLAGRDLNGPDTAEITILFNIDVDDPDVLGSVSWYYGTDAQPGFDIDLVTVALHEIGHGLGFAETVDLSSGDWINSSGNPGIFDRMLLRPQVGPFADMRQGERLAAVVSPPLLWVGPAVSMFNGSAPSMFTPEPVSSGSSVAHWDPIAAPGELMGPSSTEPMHDPGLLLPALVDMGWQLAVPSPTPRMPSATPTASATPTPTLPPAATPAQRADAVYVANFDDDTVSVYYLGKVSTIPVGTGPAGVAASADGRRVYVANFRDGSLSVISTRRAAVIDTIPVGSSANGVAVTSDGRSVVVTDPFMDEAVVVDALTHAVRSRIAVEGGPSAVAIGPNDWAFVTAYRGPYITVVDAAIGIRRGLIPARVSNLVDIAFAAEVGRGVAIGAFTSFEATRIDGNALTSSDSTAQLPARPQAVAMKRDGSEVYVAGYSTNATVHEVNILDSRLREIRRVATLPLPDSMALLSDGSRIYVTNTGANLVSIVDPTSPLQRGSVPVGASPMGVAVAAVPAICDGDCDGDRAVMIDEIVRGVNIATGASPVTLCNNADGDDDWRVTVDEIVAATMRALAGCA